MAVRYAALCACRKVHVCHCNSLGGATWRSVMITGRTDRRTDRVRRNMRPPSREEGRIIIIIQTFVRRTLSASELNLRRRNSLYSSYYLLPFVYGEWKIFIISSYSAKLDVYAVAGSYWNVCERREREREAVSQPAGCAVPWSRGAASVHDDIVNASKSHTTTDDGRTPPSVAITPHTASNLSLSLSLSQLLGWLR